MVVQKTGGDQGLIGVCPSSGAATGFIRSRGNLADISSVCKSARRLAQSRTLRVFQESSCCAQRLGVRRPSAAFPRGISNCANVNWNCYSVPARQSYAAHTLAKRHKKNISGDSCISWFKAFPSSIFHPPSFMLPSCISGRSPSSASACSAAPSGWPSTPETRAPDRGFRPSYRQPQRL